MGGGYSAWGNNDQIMPRGLSVSHMLTLTRSIDISFEKLTPELEVEFEKHPMHYAYGDGGFHEKPVFFLNIFSGDLHFDALIVGLC